MTLGGRKIHSRKKNTRRLLPCSCFLPLFARNSPKIGTDVSHSPYLARFSMVVPTSTDLKTSRSSAQVLTVAEEALTVAARGALYMSARSPK